MTPTPTFKVLCTRGNKPYWYTYGSRIPTLEEAKSLRDTARHYGYRDAKIVQEEEE